MAYLWKNQHIQQSSEQLMSIAGIIIVNLVLGSWEETSIDNLGTPSSLTRFLHPKLRMGVLYLLLARRWLLGPPPEGSPASCRVQLHGCASMPSPIITRPSLIRPAEP